MVTETRIVSTHGSVQNNNLKKNQHFKIINMVTTEKKNGKKSETQTFLEQENNEYSNWSLPIFSLTSLENNSNHKGSSLVVIFE